MNSRATFFLTAVILMLLSFPVGAISGGKQYSVKAIGNANNYPEVELVVNVRDNNSGKGIYGISKNDFTVFENGEKQTITAFTQKGEGKVDPIDIVFVFDETGSMQDEIDAVRDNSMMFADYLSSSNMDYRLALITFSDVVEKKHGFTSDINEFKDWVSSINAIGGGDDPENGLDALGEALKLKFREEAAVVFILITDAPYHHGDHVTKRHMLPLAKKIRLENIKIYPIAIKLDQYIWMARETGGSYFSILDDFSLIIEQLAVGLTAPYKLRYIPTNSSFDSTKRSVEVDISGIGKTNIKYKSSANILVSSQLMEKNRPADAYQAKNMIDGKKSTAWCEGDAGDGIGQWVKFGFEKPRKLKAIKIIAGYTKTPAIYKSNNRIKKMKVVFSDGRSQSVDLEDRQDFQRILIDRDADTSFVRLEILDVYRGAKYKDTCISEVEFEFKK